MCHAALLFLMGLRAKDSMYTLSLKKSTFKTSAKKEKNSIRCQRALLLLPAIVALLKKSPVNVCSSGSDISYLQMLLLGIKIYIGLPFKFSPG